MSIQVKNLGKSYLPLQVIDDLSMEFVPGKVHCLFGPSGCGKTTFLNLLTGLIKPEKGALQGLDDKKFSYIFQEDRLLPWATVEENILFVLENRTPLPERKKTALSYLQLVGLEEFTAHFPHQLSGGMKQRVSIARAFAYGGDVLVLDEPFKGLDHERKTTLMSFIRDSWTKRHQYMFFVTHDIEEALALADLIYVWQGPPLTLEKVIEIPLSGKQRENPDILCSYRKLLIAKP